MENKDNLSTIKISLQIMMICNYGLHNYGHMIIVIKKGEYHRQRLKGLVYEYSPNNVVTIITLIRGNLRICTLNLFP